MIMCKQPTINNIPSMDMDTYKENIKYPTSNTV
jgi:hypothetical protein